MTANQIDAFANDVAKEALGRKAGTIKDTSDYVSLAIDLEANKDLYEPVYRSIITKIGKTAFFARKWQMQDRHVDIDKMEFGIIYERIRSEWTGVSENPAWNDGAFDPDNVPNTNIKLTACYYKALASFAVFGVIENRRLNIALRSREQFGAMVEAIYIEMRNCIDYNYQQIKTLAINTLYAGALSLGNANQKINVLKIHNDRTGDKLTTATMLNSPEFLETFAEVLCNVCDAVEEPSVLFNVQGAKNQTTADNRVVEVLGVVENALMFKLKSNTYHEQLIKMPNYTKVKKWQYAIESGEESMNFDSISTISVTNDTLANANIVVDPESRKINVTKSGILACIRDKAAVVTTIEDFSAASRYNDFTKKSNNMYALETGFLVDMTQNCIVLYAEDETTPPNVSTAKAASVPVASTLSKVRASKK